MVRKVYNIFIVHKSNFIFEMTNKTIGPFHLELENEEPTLNEKNTKIIKDYIKKMTDYDIELLRIDSKPVPTDHNEYDCMVLFGMVSDEKLLDKTKGILSIKCLYDILLRLNDTYNCNLRKIFKDNLSVLNSIQ